ncbi:MAG TPA: hypothetical protein VHU87_04250 [Rhizomicrobium sp.]|jgi:hypothetical protein|nr:hypothetical protein [Rhizomicrobium sp.]
MMRLVCLAGLCALLSACAAETGQHVSLPAAPPPGEPGNIAGLNAAQIRASFGAPAFVRADGKVEIWRYDGAACKGFFFFYPDTAGMTVHHVETIPRGREIAADSDCLNALLIRKGVPVS